MKRVLVVGLGISGKSAAHFLLQKGARVTGVDKKSVSLPDLEKKGLEICLEGDPLEIGLFDLVVISPGVPLTHPLVQAAYKQGLEVIGEIELAFRYMTQKVLAITGTNGKTTVTLLTAHILNSVGINACAVGNVGVPLTSQLHLNPDVWVVELSSYQIESLRTPIIDAGVILNITPDHLDRYPNMQAYAQAKLDMHRYLKPNGTLYIQDLCKQEFGGIGKTYGFQKGSDLRCDGKCIYVQETVEYLLPEEYRNSVSHDVENLMASYALCRECGVAPDQITPAIKSFKKPSHRIEFVCNYKNVSYYDDSKGTNIDAVLKAVDTMKGEIILIAGGVDKGASYVPWIQGFNGRVSAICAIGQAASKMAQELGRAIPVQVYQSLEEAVHHAAKIAKPGGNVLLSPGCSSFDMFRDYEHRGEEFKRIVNALSGESKNEST